MAMGVSHRDDESIEQAAFSTNNVDKIDSLENTDNWTS